jgi:hypothetical protein
MQAIDTHPACATPHTLKTGDQSIELRQSHLLMLLAIETALKATQSATKMLEIALQEIRKIHQAA